MVTNPGRSRAAKVRLLGLELDNLTNQQALDALSAMWADRHSHQVNFVNAHCANVAQEDPDYLRILRSGSLCLADGSGVRLGARLLGQNVVENVNGTDLFPGLCQRLSESGGSLGLLGAKPGIAGKVADWVRERHPGVRVVFVCDGYFQAMDEPSALRAIATSDCDVLLVAMGVPAQEKWLDRHRQNLNVGAGIAVGGLFDFYSGSIPRAPLWLRRLGMEWTYRLYQEPRRLWRRYVLGNFVFIAHVLRQRRRKG
jgi:N-acetylglucosaminyldiphosphoundecaprenol N-acetyl-beta-D-mannosaminyltransferase